MITVGEAPVAPARLVTNPMVVPAYRGEVVIVRAAAISVGQAVIDIAID